MAEKKKKFLNEWWSQFLTSILGTAIGLGLTVGVDRVVENRNHEESQRLTAMMVIHDIDESIETLKKIIEEDETGHNATMYAMHRIDDLENVADSTQDVVITYLMEGLSFNTDLQFNESGEQMFHSTQDSWKNLDDLTFIRNVEEIYKDRSMLKNDLYSSAFWTKPVNKRESDSLYTNSDVFDSDQNIVTFLRRVLTSRRCQTYLRTYGQRQSYLNELLHDWQNKNNENKFLMNISDEDLKEFVEKTVRQSRAAQEQDLIGTWINVIAKDITYEHEFHADHTYKNIFVNTLTHQACVGRALVKATTMGTWSIEGDSVIIVLNPSTLVVDIDDSGLKYTPEMHDSITLGNKEYKDWYVKEFRQSIQTTGARQARATNIDRTGQMLELTTSEKETTHYRRKK